MSTVFRTKSIEVEAVQIRWSTWSTSDILAEFIAETVSPDNPGRMVPTYSDNCGESGPWIELTIITRTANGGDSILAHHGDWVVKLPGDGGFQLYGPQAFANAFELAE